MPAVPLKIQAKNCKCFGEEAQGVEAIYPINLIIGKNNSGKSALLDIVQYVTNPGSVNLVGHKGLRPEVFLTKPINNNEIAATFSNSTSGGGVPGANFFEYGSKWLNKPITVKLNVDQKQFVSIDPPFDIPANLIDQHHFHDNLVKNFQNPIEHKTFKKLAAERNIVPEGENTMQLLPDGAGASNIIQHFVNTASLGKRALVEVDLLNALNSIFGPEARFDRILPQKLDDGRWEIYLEEQDKGIISLSNSGSGLKTVILVLINLLLVPKLEGNGSLGNFIFAFEELENNLHPSLQRKLLLYIREVALRENCKIFLTTHSNVVIDLFSKDEEAQIIHIKNNGITASAKKVETYLDSSGILDDLDFRASDLLQSNGVVWVEGPSDRTYFNKWVELWAGGALKEGVHYQCLLYGGKLLAHLTASTDELEEAISILKVNRNCILIMDSDKNAAQGKINATKTRIKEEIETIQGMAWITKGKEIENYLPQEALKAHFNNDNLPELEQFKKFPEFLNEVVAEGEGDKFSDNKVLFAERLTPLLSKEMLEGVLDLNEKIEEACKRIKEWNKLV